MTTPTAAASWHVLGDQITQGTDLMPNGTGLRDYYEVPYRIDSGPAMGHQASVKVPVDTYSQATVSAAITAAVAATHGVAGLSG
jgi:hypothetical protein